MVLLLPITLIKVWCLDIISEPVRNAHFGFYPGPGESKTLGVWLFNLQITH